MDSNYKLAFEKLINVLDKLLSPGGCEWDRKQTHESLIPYLLEETHEVIEAIEKKDMDSLKEELGDLMLHILFQAKLAEIENKFNITDSLKEISAKLIERHPNVFIPFHGNRQRKNKKIGIVFLMEFHCLYLR